nr:RNA-directed DNA polymerase, eukaryota [Tanacetum cinerariifolium]
MAKKIHNPRVECQSYGRIVDAFIANKRSKARKRFGFVLFLGVKNEEQLARSLASIWIGSYHLFASVSHFNRQEKNEAFSKNNGDKTTNSIPSQKVDHVGSSQNKKSYTSSLNGDRDSKVEKQGTAVKEFEYISDNESLHGAKNKTVGSQHGEDDLVDNNDVKGVSKTFFSDKHPSPNNSVCNSSKRVVKQQFEDFFCIYDVLNKKPEGVAQDSNSSLSHPPCFTSEVSRQENDHKGVDLNTKTDKVNSPLVHMKVTNNSHEVHKNVTSNGESAFNYSHNAHNGGLILEVLDDMIRVGQSMGYVIEGCMKDIEHIIRTQGVDAIHGVFVDGDWNTDPEVVKDVFKDHFATRFKQPTHGRLKLNISFPNRLSTDQFADMDRSVSRDEIRVVVSNCGENKSPSPDGYTFEFFRRYWRFIGFDFCSAVECFFESGPFSKGSNSSFIALIPKVTDAKFITDFRPISLIGCVYRVVMKILANRLATDNLSSVSGFVTLSASKDRWIFDLIGDGVFRVKEVRTILDDIFLPSAADATRWVKYISIKINVFAWRARLDCLPTRSNLLRRGVVLDSSLCPWCGLVLEDIPHVLFRCDTAKLVFYRTCRWWDLDWHDLLSFSNWNAWFSAIRLPSRIK